ncbi:GGDEF domain-containing protein [Vallitalea pronyensis]|uniref:GGDEF domain-containing protein n=1 Tax=Vallitalea pronyensis TaxID=1348613 RepID=A0A8J8MH23_9FIRM|nr:GGDEF domain-containing protein [Vallitalea pronyensis]QUI21331.1 GGDEF domain-containing protein [Vallitalea pronyensis]
MMYLSHIVKTKLMKQILIFFIIILTTFVTTYVLMMQNIIAKQDELMNMFTSTIKVSIEENYRIANQEEREEEDELYIKLMGIGQEFIDVPLNKITSNVLYHYRDKYNLTHLSIFNKDEKDEITIARSTHPEEIGIKTTSWGFWNEAFLQLYKKGTVTLSKGVAINNFWVGPKSYSYVDYKTKGVKNYYKYAYYFNREQNYIINAVTSEESYSLSSTNRLDNLLDEYRHKIKSIKKFGIIDMHNWRSYIQNNSNTRIEPIVTYGNLTNQEFIAFNIRQPSLENLDDIRYMDVMHRGKPYKLSFTALDDNIAICTLMSTSYFQTITLPIIIAIIIISLLISLVISWVVRKEARKSDILLRREQQRLKAVEEFKNAITNVPDYIFRLIIGHDDQLMVSFNEGRLVTEDHYIGVDKEPRPIHMLYSETFITTATPYIHEAFANKKVSFEFEENDICYEVIIIPDQPNEIHQKVDEVLCFVNDVTKYVKDIQKSTYMAHHDELTGLLNRRQFNMDFDTFKASKKFAVFYLDLDGFKSVNDQHGHKAGDYVLQKISKRLTALEGLCTYRIGGDEFLIIMPFKVQRESSKMATTIIETINKPIILPSNDTIHMGVSIGISIYPSDAKDREQLINYADQAMYHAKREGKNAFFFYN